MEKFDKDTEAKQNELNALKAAKAADLSHLQELAKTVRGDGGPGDEWGLSSLGKPLARSRGVTVNHQDSLMMVTTAGFTSFFESYHILATG